MLVKAQIAIVKSNNQIALTEIPVENVIVDFPCVLSIDGSTTNTAIGLLREGDGAFCAVIDCTREKDKESAVAYKVRLKRLVQQILERNRAIRYIFYEEPFLEYPDAAEKLLMLRTFIEELIVENEPHFNYLINREINNRKWKRLFLYPDVCNGDSEMQKKMVRDKMMTVFPFLKGVSQDAIDCIAMGSVAVVKLKNGEAEELESKKKPKPFKYEIQFVGGDDDDVALQEIFDICNIPLEVLQNGISFVDLPARANFDEKIYSTMGEEDKLVIMKFSSNRHGNIVLQHRIGYLASNFDYIYAVIWRKYRKK